MLVAEKNRLQQANTDKFVKNSCINMIDVLSNQITEITNQVEVIISSDQLLKAIAFAISNKPVAATNLSSYLGFTSSFFEILTAF
ncbi:Transposase and inactivated derivative [Rickettsia bellii OSU 85-389]|nr:Transposase and inactivated derivative [Rickettsia bellii OSU 85-389]